MRHRAALSIFVTVLLILNAWAVLAQAGPPPSDPNDSDGDGVFYDDCIGQRGPASNNGCPRTQGGEEEPDTQEQEDTGDRDGDGLPDGMDRCPDHGGHANAGGCPDRDGDGTGDPFDQCPEQGGPDWNAGCPADEPENQQEAPPDEPATGENTIGEPVLVAAPDDGSCAATPAGGQAVNIRERPEAGAPVIGSLVPGSLNEILIALTIGGESWYALADPPGFVAGWVVRPLGECLLLPAINGSNPELGAIVGPMYLTRSGLNLLPAVQMPTDQLQLIIGLPNGQQFPYMLLPSGPLMPGPGSVLGLHFAAIDVPLNEILIGLLLPALCPGDEAAPSCPDSIVGMADGSVREGDGSASMADGSVREGDGSVRFGDGSVHDILLGDSAWPLGPVGLGDQNGNGLLDPADLFSSDSTGGGMLNFVGLALATDMFSSPADLQGAVEVFNEPGRLDLFLGDFNGDGMDEFASFGVGDLNDDGEADLIGFLWGAPGENGSLAFPSFEDADTNGDGSFDFNDFDMTDGTSQGASNLFLIGLHSGGVNVDAYQTGGSG